MWFGIIFGGLVVLFFWIFLAKEFASIADSKGYSNANTYFWLTLLFGVIGMLIVAALPDLKARTAPSASNSTSTLSGSVKRIPCPKCGVYNNEDATICKNCLTKLEPKPTAKTRTDSDERLPEL